MDIEQATERCNQLIKAEHANWIGISNQIAIGTVLSELERLKEYENLEWQEFNELAVKDKIIDEMLNNIGYIKYLDNEDTLIYKYERETFKVSLKFDKRSFKRTFYVTECLWVPNNSETWYTQEFKNEWDKYCAAQGYWSSIWHEFSMQELQAINEKAKELGWNE